MLQNQYPEEVNATEVEQIEFMPFVAGDTPVGRTTSGAHEEQPSASHSDDLARHHQRQRSQSNSFSQVAREQSLNRCDSCTAPLPEYNWAENY
mmetsp:Transcript_28122/g.81296  ORF Transcript_28122/g.81296 Transcript_28122/m.81296 type:complete len:93 (-) Transcript_28122:782-1060(-)